MVDKEKLPYRPCAGQVVVNRDGLVWIGRRVDEADAPEGRGKWWQMPQGGIDDGEDPQKAALRELWEETSITSVEPVGETDWITYDLPDHLVGVAWKGKYRGQRMKWFVLRFTGDESQIDVVRPGGGKHEPEFSEWRWEALEQLPHIVIDFKKSMYQRLVEELQPILARL